MSEHHNTAIETVRIAGAAVGVTIYGITLNEWVAVVTLIYLVIQIVILTPKAFAIVRGWLLNTR